MVMRPLVVLVALVLVGCAAEYREPRLSADHPARPEAGAAPAPERSGVLAEREPVGGASAAPIREEHGGHAAHEGGVHSQAAVYTCPMHPEVLSKEAGRCPKCGMALVEKEGGE
jgi:hypothetical protein